MYISHGVKMDPNASSLFAPHHSKNNLALEKSTEVEFPIQKTPMDSQPAMFSKFKAYRKPCSHESNRLGLLVPAAKAFFSFCFFNTAWPWHIPNVSGPLVRCSTVLLDWGTSEGTTNDSSDPSVGEHVCINNGHSIVPEDGVAKLHTLSMIWTCFVWADILVWYSY